MLGGFVILLPVSDAFGCFRRRVDGRRDEGRRASIGQPRWRKRGDFDNTESAIAEFVSKRTAMDVLGKAEAKDVVHSPESLNHDARGVPAKQFRVASVA